MNHPPDVNAVPGLSSTLDDGSSQKPDHMAHGGTSTLACPENPTQLMGRLLDRTSQPFAAIDFEGRITSANRAFEKLTGYTVAELLTMTIGDLTPEPWKVKMDETLVRVQSTGKSERYEKEYRRRDGTSILVEVAVDLDRDEKNRPVGYFAFVTDISERKKVENALRESEERFRRLYDEAPVGYHEIDTEGRIVNINRTECEMLGYTREEVLGRQRLRIRRGGDPRAGPPGLPGQDPGQDAAPHAGTNVRDPRRPAPVRLDRGAVQAGRAGADRRHPEHRPGLSPSGSGPRPRWWPPSGAPGAVRGDRRCRLRARPRRPHPRRQPRGQPPPGLHPRGAAADDDQRHRRPRVRRRLRGPAQEPVDPGSPLVRGPAPDQGRPRHPGRHQHARRSSSTTSGPSWPSSATSPSARRWRRPAASSPRRRCGTPARWRPRTAP